MQDYLTEKYRPKEIESLCGQPFANIVYELSSTYIAPSYLFFGTPGTGKTSFAYILASKIENNLDLRNYKSDFIEVNCGMNGNVDSIKELIDKLNIPPRILKREYVILDEAHMMTSHSQNALLNIMESPPSFLTFILCTTEKNKILPAVQSRCMQVKFLPINDKSLVDRLEFICQKESIEHDIESLEIIAQQSNHSMRESIVLLSTYKNLGVTKEVISQYIGFITSEYIENLIINCLNKSFKEVTQQVTDIKKYNINYTSCLRLIYEKLIDSVIKKMNGGVDKIIECSTNNKISLVKCCDILDKSLKDLSPQVPEELHFQTVIFKLTSI